MGSASPRGFRAMGEYSQVPMRQKSPSQVPKMFKDVTCPYPAASTFYGKYGAMNYSLEGPESGEIVLCFHGLNASRTMFKQIAPALAKAGYRVLAFDLYGHGLSNAPPVSLWPCRRCRGFPCGTRRGRYDLDFFVEQTSELLASLDLSDQRLNLVGFSLGGSLAVAFAQQFPEKVLRMCLLSPAGCLPKLPKKYCLLKTFWCILIPLANHLLSPCCYRKDKFSKSMKGEDPEVIQSMWSRMVWSLFIKKGVASASLATMLRVPWSGLENLFKDVGRDPRPVLLLWGKDDPLNPTTNAAKKVHELFGNSYLLVIKDAQHIVIADQPQQVFNALYDFLRMPADINMRKVNLRTGETSRLVSDTNHRIERLGNTPAPGIIGSVTV